MTARTSNLNPHISMRVRGGFSLLQGGAGQGLGDLCDPTDPSCQQSGPFVSIANPELNVSSSSGSTNTSGLIIIGLGVLALMLFAKR